MTQETTIASIKQLYINLNELITKNDLKSIDQLLKDISSSEQSYEIKTSILRYTYSIKDNLSYWNITLDNIKKEMDETGLNSNEILMGLI